MAIITLQCDSASYDRLTNINCIDTISENLKEIAPTHY